jgi:hypothetical protein
MSAQPLAECREATNDSHLIQMRYKGYVANQHPIPAPRIWQRRPKNNSQNQNHADQNHAAANPPNGHIGSQLVVNEQTGRSAVLPRDEWSDQFLFLVNASTDMENLTYVGAICHDLTRENLAEKELLLPATSS